ncbi:MAG: hypothetical protein KF724_08575 [Phycisphaeraceae bacterium]|nr:hypothetical protein [Phycisphaeraceae bacterium]
MTSTAKRSGQREPRPDLALLVGAGLAIGGILFTSGCKKKEEPPPVVVQDEAPPPPPPQPTPTDLFAKYNIDPRITIAPDEIPVDEQDPERGTQKLVAVLQFFDAMVRGSDDRLRPMLASADQQVLAQLVQSGQFQSAAGAVTRVLLGCGTFQLGFETSDAVFALIQSGSRIEPQLWTFTLDENGKATFDAVPAPPDILMRLTGTKAAPRIRQWAQVLKEKMDEALKPDEEIKWPTINYSTGDEEGSEGGDAPAGGAPPTRDPDAPGKRPPRPGVPAPRPPSPGG